MATNHDGIEEPTNGTNGSPANALLARLSERSQSQQGQLKSQGRRIAALEQLAIDTEGRRNSFRSWLPAAAIIVGGFFGFFVFGIEPLKSTDADLKAALIAADVENELRRTQIIDLLRKEAVLMNEIEDGKSKLRAAQNKGVTDGNTIKINEIERRLNRFRVEYVEPE